jgi:hypothetical protein
MAVSSTAYVNPLGKAIVRPERIDQGVDYAGTGSLVSIGEAQVTQAGTDGTGWPGAFIEYQLLTGADAGCYVFYAEGVTPSPGLHIGETVTAGQVIATIVPHTSTGFEIGWGGPASAPRHTWRSSGSGPPRTIKKTWPAARVGPSPP